MSKVFYVGQGAGDCPIKVVLNKSKNRLFLFQDERLALTLSANDIFLMKDEIDTERGYTELVRVYLMRMIEDMKPDFKLALCNEEYIEDVAEAYANQVRDISILSLTDKMRKMFFENAFLQVDYRQYTKKNDDETKK